MGKIFKRMPLSGVHKTFPLTNMGRNFRKRYSVQRRSEVRTQKSTNFGRHFIYHITFRVIDVYKIYLRTKRTGVSIRRSELLRIHSGLIKIHTSIQNKQTNSVALVRERTIPTERPPPVGEVSANFCG